MLNNYISYLNPEEDKLELELFQKVRRLTDLSPPISNKSECLSFI